MNWIFNIYISDEADTTYTKVTEIQNLLYKTEPNDDYKDAIKKPLRELSEFLKKKLSE